MREFLTDFGMHMVREDADALYMRGYGAAPFVHVTERGDPGFVGFGIWAASEADLLELAASENQVAVESDAPGGGLVLRLTDPDGFVIEVLAEQKPAERLPLPDHVPWNHGGRYPRQGGVRRVSRAPSHVLRLGHVVISVKDFQTSERWYKDRFGLLTSDEIRPGGEGDRPIGAFLRCNRGDDPCDHHTIFLIEMPPEPRFVHSAFEVADLDDLMGGHEYMKQKEHEHFWGVGRHKLGSQVFDYWKDPWGHEIEHWTDGDKLPASLKGGIGTLDDLLGVQWGMRMPGAPPPL